MTVEMDIPDTITSHAGRFSLAMKIIQEAFSELSLPSPNAIGDVRVVDLNGEQALMSWNNDPEVKGINTWNSWGQNISDRQFHIREAAPDKPEAGFVLELSSDKGVSFKSLAIVTHPDVAKPIGEAFEAGCLSYHPAKMIP